MFQTDGAVELKVRSVDIVLVDVVLCCEQERRLQLGT